MDTGLINVSTQLTSQIINLPSSTRSKTQAEMASTQPTKLFEHGNELTGVLYKYTNVMKGWQFRWFTLDYITATLSYHEKEDFKTQKPRGTLNLIGAVIAPSEDDSVTFTIHAANTEIYRLRADDARMRQNWVSHLRLAVERAGSADSPSPVIQTHTRTVQTSKPALHPTRPTLSTSWYTENPKAEKAARIRTLSDVRGNPALDEVKEYVHEMYTLEEQLLEKIEQLPLQGSHINALDKDMLMLKACSSATVECLEQCVSLLEQQVMHAARVNNKNLPIGAKIEWMEPIKPSIIAPLTTNNAEQEENLIVKDSELRVPPINHADEQTDPDCGQESDLDNIEQHKSVILHLLSQLKLGMDLTKVVLPTFILEKRSLLELFADCMAHPDYFIRISEKSTTESRMMQVVEWYLTSFHEGRKGTAAKKPYNPIIGETFHCSWEVPCSDNGDSTTATGSHRLVYTAEQVSHHPPISAFHVSCADKDIYLTGSLWTKSKFMGMSIGVTMIGNLTLSLPKYKEEYVMTLPSAYARSILTFPWVELGDKCTITCQSTGYTSNIIFHTKPFYGGKLHRISGEVKNNNNTIISTISGAWNSSIQLAGTAGNKTIEISHLPVFKKKVRPISMQGEFESRKLWQHVTNALKLNDIKTATDHKSLLESKQRETERHRKERSLPFPTKYFQKVGTDISNWIYKSKNLS